MVFVPDVKKTKNGLVGEALTLSCLWVIVMSSFSLTTFILITCHFACTRISDSVFSYSLCSGGLDFFSFLPSNLIGKKMMFSVIYSWICYAGSKAITSTQSLGLGSMHSDIEAALYLEG